MFNPNLPISKGVARKISKSQGGLVLLGLCLRQSDRKLPLAEIQEPVWNLLVYMGRHDPTDDDGVVAGRHLALKLALKVHQAA